MYRIIVVDDEPIIRSVLAKKVEENSEIAAIVGVLADGQEALKWLDAHYADICITDVRMPNLNGLQLIERINERFPWMSCIVVSSYDDFDYVKQSLQLQVIDYVLKPVDSQDLRRVLQQAVSGLEKRRHDEAARLLLRMMPNHLEMLKQWRELLASLQTERLPQLIIDTLEMLEEWAKERWDLLPHLAVQWIGVLAEGLCKESQTEAHQRFQYILQENREWANYPARRMNRMCAVYQLELGARKLADWMQGEKNRQGRRIISQVKAFIHDHYAEKITLQEIADAVSMSRTYLASLFKQETGMTVLNYLVKVRMEKARELLLNTPMKIYEITLAVGYEDSIYFSKLFREYFGLNPMEYKKRMVRQTIEERESQSESEI